MGNVGDQVSVTITVFRSEERIDYVPILESITFTGDDDWVDTKTTPMLFEMIAKSAISQGLLLGYETCSMDCATVDHKTRVYLPSCVKRTGLGIATTFLDCNPANNCIREYIVCCPNGIEAPVTQQVFMQCGSCTGDYCESTCP